jgi:phospholipid/cholesterol/gamma-HCH transport system substrate-binding protein
MSREFRLGLFIAFTLAILATGIFLIGNTEMMFRPTYHVKATFDNVAGLVEGANVRVGGIAKGTVQKIQLPDHPDGKVVVVMNVDRSTRSIVKTDSRASIKSEGLLGDKYMEVSFGSNEAPQVKEGDMIQSQPPIDIADLINKTDKILDTTQDTINHVDSATGDLQMITAKVNNGQGSVGAMINDKTMYQQVTAGATAFSEDMEAMKHNFLLRGFFRNRGYEDAADLKKNEIARLPAQQAVKSFTYPPAKLFAKPEAAKLKNAKDSKELNDVGHFLEQNPFGLAVVQASTGPKGDKDKNLTLSQAQAMVVRSYLSEHFKLDDERLKTRGAGEGQAEGGQVDVLIYGTDVQPPKTDVQPQKSAQPQNNAPPQKSAQPKNAPPQKSAARAPGSGDQ